MLLVLVVQALDVNHTEFEGLGAIPLWGVFLLSVSPIFAVYHCIMANSLEIRDDWQISP